MQVKHVLLIAARWRDANSLKKTPALWLGLGSSSSLNQLTNNVCEPDMQTINHVYVQYRWPACQAFYIKLTHLDSKLLFLKLLFACCCPDNTSLVIWRCDTQAILPLCIFLSRRRHVCLRILSFIHSDKKFCQKLISFYWTCFYLNESLICLLFLIIIIIL